MKATCNREALLTACQTASMVLPARSPKPVLRKMLFEVSAPDQATLYATDLEQAIEYRVSGVEVQTPGKVLLPSQEFVSILRELGDDTFVLTSTDSGLNVRGASSKFDFPSEDPASFPELPGVTEGASFKLKASVLAMMIRRTIFAAAAENSRFHMCSVLMEFETDGSVYFVATDGKRLALMPGKAEVVVKQDKTVSVLAPPKALSLLSKVLHDPDEEIVVVLGDNEAVFRSAKAVIYTRLVEGRFPPWRTVVPPEAPTKVPIGVDRLTSALRQAKIVTSMESRAVKFHFEAGELVLRGQGADVGEAEVKLPVAFDKDKIEITFDPEYMLEALRVLDPSEEILLGFADTKKQATIRSGDDYTYVLMPVSRDG